MSHNDCDFKYNKEYNEAKLRPEGIIAPGQEQQDWKYYRHTREDHSEMVGYLDSIPETKNND